MAVKIADKIIQMNNGTYPLMDASAIEYTKQDGTVVRVDEALDNINLTIKEDIIVEVPHGKITEGTNLNGMSFSDIIRKMFTITSKSWDGIAFPCGCVDDISSDTYYEDSGNFNTVLGNSSLDYIENYYTTNGIQYPVILCPSGIRVNKLVNQNNFDISYLINNKNVTYVLSDGMNVSFTMYYFEKVGITNFKYTWYIEG